MPLTAEQEWMLTAHGLIAMADRVLTGAEATRVLTLANQHLEGEEQDQWMDLLTDLDALVAHFATLKSPTTSPEPLLEELWSVALIDGDASMAEVRMLEKIGKSLGVDVTTVNTWRRKWTTEVIETGDFAARFIAGVFPRAGDGGVSSEDQAHFEKLINSLPISMARRKKLMRCLERPPAIKSLVRELSALSAETQTLALETLGRILERSAHREAGKARLAELRDALAGADAAS